MCSNKERLLQLLCRASVTYTENSREQVLVRGLLREVQKRERALP